MLENKGERILAKSLFRELRSQGYSANQILGLTNELLDLVTQDLHDEYAAAVGRETGDSEEETERENLPVASDRNLH